MTPAITPELRERAGKDRPLAVLDLFSGIGGFSLGLERTGGFKTVAFCEIEPFCRRVLAKHWPEVPNLGDVSAAEFPEADVITAGFPCQDISSAGNRSDRAGLSGARSGLFWQVVRAIRLVRPRLVLLENVAALLDRGMGVVLGALAEIGHDAEWDCIPAAAVGAPCIRDRLFVAAYPHGTGRRGLKERNLFAETGITPPRRRHVDGLDLAEAGPWSACPDVLRVDYGLPGTVDRLRAAGNAIVPKIAELIGRAILANIDAPPATPLATGEAA
ncbi:DNA cytosine methyltransferase [Methylorubrum extorquens]|uniref:DNA cytosine methyltransferase n=1 Tax=Methylorubrum extorquens TaxID=408 RepID=UPI0022377FAC|nr:DNA (cytosine-5-)-methyltransferase [Methylorubrum extorquens]UYW32471.1 DNA (cytosine-5-)-methyltransferase [Methylorubrum extorquens]